MRFCQCTFFTYILFAEFQTVKDEILQLAFRRNEDKLHEFQTVKDEILLVDIVANPSGK